MEVDGCETMTSFLIGYWWNKIDATQVQDIRSGVIRMKQMRQPPDAGRVFYSTASARDLFRKRRLATASKAQDGESSALASAAASNSPILATPASSASRRWFTSSST